jgi:uncharacterized protein YifE (UPF0438 family)
VDFAADKVIKKYQTATCDELKAQRKDPPTDKEKEAIEFLRNDSQARIFFINKDRRYGTQQDVRLRHDPVSRGISHHEPEPLYP